MKKITFIALAAVTAQSVVAQIVIKPVRTPNTATNRPGGIIVPGPDGSPVPQVQKPQIIQLLNGDELKGSFVGFDSKGGAKWRHPAVKAPITFEADSVSKVILHPRKSQVPASQNCRVTMRSGQEILGELIALDDKTLTIDAWYSRNNLRIPREQIAAISPGGQPAGVIYEGPVDGKGWVGANNANFGAVPQMQKRIQINGRLAGGLVPPGFGGRPVGAAGWAFSKKSFISRRSGGQIGRRIKFEDQTNMEFDLTWTGSFNVAVYICSDKMVQHGSNAYIVGLSQYNCYLMRNNSRTGQNNIGNANLPAQFRGKIKARVSIRVDKKKNSISLLMDDKLIKQWVDSTGFAGKGDHVMFVSNSSNSQMKVSNIRVTRWDGSLPTGGGSKDRDLEKDRLRSTDSDFTGELVGIANGKVKFNASFGPVNMDVEKVASLEFAGETKKEKPQLGIGDVKVTLANGGDFIFRLESWTVDRVTGVSPIFGRVDFRPDAFAAVEFNLNKKRTSEDDDPFDF